MAAFRYEFEWDRTKARTNLDKHGLNFEQAATVFLDPLALTLLDDEHGETETRWATIGRDRTGSYVLVVHTFEELTHNRGRVRLISARRPTKAEIRNYEEHDETRIRLQ